MNPERSLLQQAADEAPSEKQQTLQAEQLLRAECISDTNASGDLLRVVMESPHRFYIDLTLKNDVGQSSRSHMIIQQQFTDNVPLDERAEFFVATFEALLHLTTSELLASVERRKDDAVSEASQEVHHMVDLSVPD